MPHSSWDARLGESIEWVSIAGDEVVVDKIRLDGRMATIRGTQTRNAPFSSLSVAQFNGAAHVQQNTSN